MIAIKNIYLIVMLIIPHTIHCITCDSVLKLPKNNRVSLEDIKNMTPKDIVDCLPYFGKEPIWTTDSEVIWESIITFYGNILSIPDDILAKLHWITPAIKNEEYADIKISTIDVVKNFGIDYGLDLKLLQIIADRVRKGFAQKVPEDYTFYDLKALNQILCGFNRSEIERIHPLSYKDAAVIIGRLKPSNCNPDTMRGFATLAVHKNAFGPSEKWTGLIVKAVGNVAEYLPGGLTKELINRRNAEKEEVDETGINAKIYF